MAVVNSETVVPPHSHNELPSGVNEATDWNVSTLKEFIDAGNGNNNQRQHEIIRRIELAIESVHKEIQIRESASEKATDKALTNVELQNETLRQEVAQRASSVLEAVNTLAKTNEARFAKQEELSGAVATLQVELAAMRREYQLVNTSNQLAIDKADAATEQRFHAVNAFREQLAAQAVTFMPRELAESKINETANTLAGRISTNERSIAELRSWRDTQSGQDKGVSASIGWIIAAIGVVGTILTILIVVMNFMTGTQ